MSRKCTKGLRRFALYWSMLVGLHIFSFAQPGDIVFQKVNDGLSQNTVTAMVQDELGFIWFGTRYGLNSFDGVEFVNYRNSKSDSNSIKNEAIESLLYDGHGKIWIGTYGGGISLFDIYTKEFSKPDEKLKGAGQYIMELYKDTNGKIWIGSFNNGLSFYDPGTNEFYNFLTGSSNRAYLQEENIPAICEDSQGNLWVGTGGGGLKLLRKGSGLPGSPGFIRPETYLDGKTIRCLHKGKSGRLWVGANDGIREMTANGSQFNFSIDPSDNDEKYRELASSAVLSILETNNKVWIGTENKGLFLLNLSDQSLQLFKKNDQTFDASGSLNGNSIWALFEDRDGTVWISSYLRGLNKVDPYVQKFKTIQQAIVAEKVIPLDLVSSFAEDAAGNVWVGTDGSGLFHYDPVNGRFLQHFDLSTAGNLNVNEVVSLLYDRQGNLWVGTWNGGLNILYNGTREFVQFKKQPPRPANICGKNIHALFQDSKGRVWIAAFSNGLDCYDPVSGLLTHFEKGNGPNDLLSNNIRAIAEDGDGNIWLGMEANGVQRVTLDDELNIINSKSFLTRKKDQVHHGTRINTIFLDETGQIWLASAGEGLYQYIRETDVLRRYTREDGLPSDMVYAVGTDDIGNLWGSTNRGLFCMNLLDQSVRTFTVGDGLQSNEFYKKSFFKTASGELFFGGINGFNQFDAKNVLGHKNAKPPSVYITAVTAPDQKEAASTTTKLLKGIYNDQQLDLEYWQNDLTFQFAATNYIQAEKNRYKFKLENYDEEWRENGNGRIGYYTNIPPGDYRFRVLAANNDGVWNETGAQLSIRIASPWYATKAAYLLYGLLIVGGLLWARNNIIARERLKNQLEMEHVELMKMQELGQLKSQFFANISHEFKTPLTLIMTPVRALMDVNPLSPNSKHYQTILNNSERLLQLVNQIMDLSKLESGHTKLKSSEQDLIEFLREIGMTFSGYADQHHMDYEMVLPDKKIPLFFEKEKMEKVIVNLLSNAFKFTRKYGAVSLRVEEQDDRVEIHVEDNGKGIHPDEHRYVFDRFFKSDNSDNSLSTGIGLSLTKQLVELHKGQITFYSELDKGTCFVVTLRKGDAHLDQDQIVRMPIPFEYREESSLAFLELDKNNPSSTGNSAPKEERQRILIVEDNDELREFLVSFLESKYEVIEADNGEDGFKKALHHMPDIVITDLMMPQMDGYSLTAKLKADKLTSHIMVIMLTVKSSGESREEGLRRGVNHYLTKPFNPAHLELLIHNMLESRQQFKNQLMSRHSTQLAPMDEAEPYTEMDEEFLNGLVKAVEANLKDPDFKIDDLCRIMGFSKSQLYRKLKSLVGQSANEFIRSIRLKKAAQLLTQRRNLKVSEITYMVGFNDLHYFRDCFKKQYGMSPTSYVRQVDKGQI